MVYGVSGFFVGTALDPAAGCIEARDERDGTEEEQELMHET